MSEDNPRPLTREKKVDLLMAEYGHVRAEIQLYVRELSPKLTMFGSVLVATFGVSIRNAFESPEQGAWGWIGVMFPIVLLLLAQVTIAQSYLIGVLVRRARDIEKEVALLAGEPIVRWEHQYSTIYVFSPRLPCREGGFSVNPLYVATALTIVVGVLLIVFGGIGGVKFLLGKSSIVASGYAALVACSLFAQVLQAWSFFEMGRSDVEQDTAKPPLP